MTIGAWHHKTNKKESADDIVESAVKSNVMAHYGVSYDIRDILRTA